MNTRTRPQHRLDLYLATVLGTLPKGYLLPDETLREEIALRAHPRPLAAEIEDSIRHQESEGRIHGLRAETGVKWSLTETGRVWWEQNR